MFERLWEGVHGEELTLKFGGVIEACENFKYLFVVEQLFGLFTSIATTGVGVDQGAEFIPKSFDGVVVCSDDMVFYLRLTKSR